MINYKPWESEGAVNIYSILLSFWNISQRACIVKQVSVVIDAIRDISPFVIFFADSSANYTSSSTPIIPSFDSIFD